MPREDMPREDQNLTKYDEKYILPIDGRSPAAAVPPPERADSPLSAPSVAPTLRGSAAAPTAPSQDRNYVFGEQARNVENSFDERKYVFGDPSYRQSEPTYRQNEQYAGSGSYSAAVDQSAQSERPMVFVMRSNSDMYVYEYSDRLEYFRNTNLGMVYCATKFKTVKH